MNFYINKQHNELLGCNYPNISISKNQNTVAVFTSEIESLNSQIEYFCKWNKVSAKNAEQICNAMNKNKSIILQTTMVDIQSYSLTLLIDSIKSRSNGYLFKAIMDFGSFYETTSSTPDDLIQKLYVKLERLGWTIKPLYSLEYFVVFKEMLHDQKQNKYYIPLMVHNNHHFRLIKVSIYKSKK